LTLLPGGVPAGAGPRMMKSTAATYLLPPTAKSAFKAQQGNRRRTIHKLTVVG